MTWRGSAEAELTKCCVSARGDASAWLKPCVSPLFGWKLIEEEEFLKIERFSAFYLENPRTGQCVHNEIGLGVIDSTLAVIVSRCSDRTYDPFELVAFLSLHQIGQQLSKIAEPTAGKSLSFRPVPAVDVPAGIEDQPIGIHLKVRREHSQGALPDLDGNGLSEVGESGL